ncbi:PAS domain S-box protein [Fischerella sp. JS2]|uniref:PAS domain S-box protein n=1 Tax=Fischerella sp. JS2 TaxID=2597771 RepID=UPI0028EF7386|nr:PAS domain S-box protein [Fischerella sp. JS2]
MTKSPSHLLAEAEKAQVLGQVTEAEEYYEQAIDTAKVNGSLQAEALAYELAAKFYLERGRLRFAHNYITEAYYAYRRLDATAKIKQLETQYPQLLSELSLANSRTSTDLEAVIRANQAIASEIELERSLSVLMKILIENAEAQTGYLILPCQTASTSTEKWAIAASGTRDIATNEQIIVLQSLPIIDRLPVSVINYVIQTLESVVVDDATREGNFINDTYIDQHQTKSILCLPLLHQEKLLGIVYLENNVTNGVFTKERFQALKLLSAQAAISLHNAKLYTQLRESEQQLRARERQLTQILEAIPIGVTAHNTNGEFIYSNQKARQLLGINAQLELKSEQISQFFQAYQAQTNQLYPIDQLPIVRALAGESVQVDDMELRQADKTVPLEVLTTPIFDETGTVIYAIAAFSDITERKQAQKLLANYHQTLEAQIAERTETLQQQHEILQTLFDHMPVMLKIRDQAGQTVFINREYECVLGWSLSELRESDWLAKCYPDLEQRQKVEEHIQAATGKWQDFKTRCRDDRYVDTTWANIRLSNGWTVGIGKDISDRKRLEEALKASQAKLNDILNSAEASIASFRLYPDHTWEDDYRSIGCEKVFGYTPQELTGTVWSSRVPAEDVAAINEQALAAIPQGQTITVEYRFHHKNGSLRWIAETLTSRWEQTRGCWVVTMVGVDITARKQAEEALQKAYKQLEEYSTNQEAVNQELQHTLEDLQVLEEERQEQNCRLLIEQQRYEDLFNFAPDGYLVTDAKGEILEANHAIATLLSVELGFLAGKLLVSFIPESARQVFRTQLSNLSSLPDKQTWELSLQPKNGEPFPVEITVAPVRDARKLIALRWLIRDITERKQAETALRESEERFREIAENINQLLFVWSADSQQFLYISPGYEKIYGLSCESLYQNPRSWLEVVHPDDRGFVLQSLEQQYQGKHAQREYRIITSDGTIRWMFAEVFPIFDQAGNLLRYIGLTEDITERKRAEEALRLREHEFRALVENAPDVISRVDREYRFRYINPRVESETGIPPTQWIGKTELEMGFPETVVNPWHAALEHVFETGQEQVYEAEFPCLEGINYWLCRLVPELAEDGSVATVLSIGRNITNRKRAEEALRESEQFLRSIYEGIAAAIFIVDVLEDGSFRYVGINPAHERISGLLSAEVAGKTPAQVLSPEDAEAVTARYRACVIARKRITNEERLVIKGKESWWITNLSPLQSEDGRIYRLIGSCFNITRRKKLEQSLQLQAEQERLIRTITQHIRQSLDLEQILKTTVVEVQQTLQADRVLISRLNQDGSGQIIEEAVVPEYPMTYKMRWVDECFPDECYEYYRQGNPRILPDVAKDEWAACLIEFMQQIGVKSKVVAPIVQNLEDSSTKVWGLLIVHACSHYLHWKASEAEFLQQISDQLAIAIHQADLYQQLQIELAERKQMQLVLQERQAILRAIGDNLPKGFIFQLVHVPDQGVYFSYISAGIEDLIGLKPEAIIQDANVLRSLIYEEDKVVRQKLAQKSLKTLCIFEMQMRFRTLRGNIIWLDVRSTPRRLRDSRTVWDGVGTDITDIKQTEDALRRSEAHLAMAQKVAQIGSWEFDLQSQKINWSQTTFHHWGIEPTQGEPSFAELLERVHPEDRQVLQQHVERAITQGIPYAFDLRIVLPDGSIRYLDSRAEPLVNAQGQVIKLIGTSLDITDRKQTEEALRESEERFRKAFDAAPIGMALVSPQGQFLKVNRSLCDIAGYSEAEMLALTFMDVTHADDLEASLEAMQRMLANEIRVYQAEKRYLHKRGDVIYILLNVSLVKDQHRQPLYFIAQIEDISDRYKVDRMKNEFISIVSHELRTPLTAIRGSLGILETGVFDYEPEQAKEMLQIAFNNSDRLVRLVNDILDLERLESGKTQLVIETCEIADLVQQAIETVQAIAKEAGVQISLMITNMQIWAAPHAIVQTLINLLSNAIKFSPVGGTVWLSTEVLNQEIRKWGDREMGRKVSPHHTDPTTPSPHLPNSYILFAIKDQGRGIPPEKLESIFGRFQQVDASDSRQKGGTGLGLSICKSIVEQHGGHIWVESVLGEGSTFYFTLPLRRGEA